MNTSGRIKISLVVPESAVRRTGNRCTAAQWAELLQSLGHEVVVEENGFESDSDILIALHASRNHETIRQFRRTRPDGKLIVALTGSDIYPEPDSDVFESIELADRLVVLQQNAIEKVPEPLREKARVIIQSAERRAEKSPAASDQFDVCVVGHLREVKDPLRAAVASRLLPENSRIRLRHAGGILEEKYRDEVNRERRENPRYQWLGELDEADVAELIASCRLMVVSSLFEGGARVVGEAIVHETPVVSSRIDGVTGLLGDDYPGYFPVGNTEALAALMTRAESDHDFLEALGHLSAELAPQFHPDRERKAWQDLIDEMIAGS